MSDTKDMLTFEEGVKDFFEKVYPYPISDDQRKQLTQAIYSGGLLVFLLTMNIKCEYSDIDTQVVKTHELREEIITTMVKLCGAHNRVDPSRN